MPVNSELVLFSATINQAWLRNHLGRAETQRIDSHCDGRHVSGFVRLCGEFVSTQLSWRVDYGNSSHEAIDLPDFDVKKRAEVHREAGLRNGLTVVMVHYLLDKDVQVVLGLVGFERVVASCS